MSDNGLKISAFKKKFTMGGSAKVEDASSSRYQGWTSKGINHFNELNGLIKKIGI